MWAAGCRSKYMGFFGRIRFIRKPICIIGESKNVPSPHTKYFMFFFTSISSFYMWIFHKANNDKNYGLIYSISDIYFSNVLHQKLQNKIKTQETELCCYF
ncbi:Potassium voltage-gated channel subfamily KQT member 1 [Portunus trituberculatus]|uniref:Potassium voltage-gated channel subfamily KQT member 1 n=1 Tax=Portunus trituberculatus TaxID=210409 RepID=A0A5B7J0D6_PORTR|nr:Potassium voltage-gated channel subfamily KQT member 1 [Portunus trituberculatus]